MKQPRAHHESLFALRPTGTGGGGSAYRGGVRVQCVRGKPFDGNRKTCRPDLIEPISIGGAAPLIE